MRVKRSLYSFVEIAKKIIFFLANTVHLKSQEIIEISLKNFSSRIPRDIGQEFQNISNLIIQNSNLNLIRRDDFTSMIQMRKLQLYQNKIQKIDFDSFYELKNLALLDLDRNQITSLPAKLLAESRNLHVFSAAYNKIKEIPQKFFDNTKFIRKINLRDNQIYNFDFMTKSSHKFEHLAFLNLRKNDQKCDKFYSIEKKIADKLFEIETKNWGNETRIKFSSVTAKSVENIVFNVDIACGDDDEDDEYYGI